MQQFGVACKGAIFDESRLFVLYKTLAESGGRTEKAARIDLPGGRLKFGEQPQEALVREIREETGLNVSIGRPLDVWTFHPQSDLQLVGITFLCRTIDGQVQLSAEHEGFDWMTKEQMAALEFPEREAMLALFDAVSA